MSEVKLYGPNGEQVKLDQFSKKRNLLFSTPMMSGMPSASFSKWSVKKTVKEGLKSSVWVYRSNELIAQSASIVKMLVTDANNMPVDNHAVTSLLATPNAQISRKDMMHLIYIWLSLTGLSYFLRVMKGKTTIALWPVSPDRINPVRSKKIDSMIEGYSEKASGAGGGAGKQKIKYKPEEIIPFRVMDPANPMDGVSPLLASSKIVDTDTEQQKFNKAAMQNRGVVEGLVSFKQPMSQEQLDTQVEAWQENNAGERTTAFLGSEAKYERFSMTPAEMDFISSRKQNRDEILAAYGVPPQLVGAQESSTYNNFRVAEIVLWRMTIVPLVDIVADALTFAFRTTGEIAEDQTVTPDYSEVHALQQNFEDKSKSAERMFKMGIPVQEINRILHMGLQEYEDWDKSYNGKNVAVSPASGNLVVDKTGEAGSQENARAAVKAVPTMKDINTRADEVEGEAEDRENLALVRSKDFLELFTSEKEMVETILKGSNPVGALEKLQESGWPLQDNWDALLDEVYKEAGLEFGSSITIEGRAFEDDLLAAIETALEEEQLILIERSGIEATTATLVIEQVKDGLEQGLSINEIMEAIDDTGMFGADRSLMIARTTVGTGASIGQLEAGKMTGASKKVWNVSGFNVRDLHNLRSNEHAKINGEFMEVQSPNGSYPRYPLDPSIHASDRINCRCFMTFE